MIELKEGDSIAIQAGGEAKVKKELGRGGQGIVYLVDYKGKEYALKWYTISVKDKFYDNLSSNINRGKPSDSFLWPQMLTMKKGGTFGYLMELRPFEYADFGDLMLAKTQFGSLSAMLNAALNICSGFQRLHILGLSYLDLNDGNFFVNVKTGEVLICDNDNVVPDGQDTGIRGKSGYMAPEIIEGENPRNTSDLFSLAVVLFILFFNNRPFEGQKVMSCPCMTEDAEKKLYGKETVFILDEHDASNRPVKGLHNNVLRRWPVFPQLLKDTFVKAFAKNAIIAPSSRVIDREWEKVLLRLRDSLVVCPHCKRETFIDLDKDASSCMACNKAIQKPAILKVGSYNIALLPGQKVYKSHTHANIKDYKDEMGVVVANPNNPNLYGIRNTSESTWRATTTQGEIKPIESGEVIPVMAGIKIAFPSEKAEIV